MTEFTEQMIEAGVKALFDSEFKIDAKFCTGGWEIDLIKQVYQAMEIARWTEGLRLTPKNMVSSKEPIHIRPLYPDSGVELALYLDGVDGLCVGMGKESDIDWKDQVLRVVELLYAKLQRNLTVKETQ